jgi:hypothetical protein
MFDNCGLVWGVETEFLRPRTLFWGLAIAET